MELSKVPSA